MTQKGMRNERLRCPVTSRTTPPATAKLTTRQVAATTTNCQLESRSSHMFTVIIMSGTRFGVTGCLEARSAYGAHLLLSWSEPVCSVSGDCSMSLVSAPFWHAAGTGWSLVPNCRHVQVRTHVAQLDQLPGTAHDGPYACRLLYGPSVPQLFDVHRSLILRGSGRVTVPEAVDG